jgi:hypothetical protein
MHVGIAEIYAIWWRVSGLLKYGDYGMRKSEHVHRIAKGLTAWLISLLLFGVIS